MAILLEIAARNLVARAGRNVTLVVAIAAITAFLVMLLGFSEGVSHTLLEGAFALRTGHVTLGGFHTRRPRNVEQYLSEVPAVVQSVRRILPKAQVRVRGWRIATLISPERKLEVSVQDLQPDDAVLGRSLKLRAGALKEVLSGDGALIFAGQSARQHLSIGDPFTLLGVTRRNEVNSVDLRVVAIAEELGPVSKNFVLVSGDVFDRMFDFDASTRGNLFIQLDSPGDAEAAERALRAGLTADGFAVLPEYPRSLYDKLSLLTEQRWTGQKLSLTRWEDALTGVKFPLDAIHVVGGMLTVVFLILMAVGVMNTMWIAIEERTSEIGTLRALGMRPGQVLSMVLLEACVLGAVASCAGALGGYTLCGVLNRLKPPLPLVLQSFLAQPTLEWGVRPAALGLVVAGVTVGTAFFALFPARRAARIPTLAAMQISE